MYGVVMVLMGHLHAGRQSRLGKLSLLYRTSLPHSHISLIHNKC